MARIGSSVILASRDSCSCVGYDMSLEEIGHRLSRMHFRSQALSKLIGLVYARTLDPDQ